MEHLTKKTTILLSPTLYDRLTRLAELRNTSLGELIRRACEREYGNPTVAEKLAAVRELATLNLPVADVQTMKAESIIPYKELLP